MYIKQNGKWSNEGKIVSKDDIKLAIKELSDNNEISLSNSDKYANLPDGMPGEVLMLGYDNKPAWTVYPTSTPQNLGLGQIVYTANTKTPIEGTVFANGKPIIREQAPELYDTLAELDPSNYPIFDDLIIHDIFENDITITDETKGGSGATTYYEFIVNNKYKFRQTGYNYGSNYSKTSLDKPSYMCYNIFRKANINSNNLSDTTWHGANSASSSVNYCNIEILDGTKYSPYSIRFYTGWSSYGECASLTFKAFNDNTNEWDTLFTISNPTNLKWLEYNTKYTGIFYNKFEIKTEGIRSNTGCSLVRFYIYGSKENGTSITDYRVLPKVITNDGSVACVVATSGLQDWTKERVVGYLGNKKIYEIFLSGTLGSTLSNWQKIIDLPNNYEKCISLSAILDRKDTDMESPLTYVIAGGSGCSIAILDKKIQVYNTLKGINGSIVTCKLQYTKTTD